MSKKIKSPEQQVPSEIQANDSHTGPAPDIQLQKEDFKSDVVTEDQGPTLTPPDNVSFQTGEESYGAAVWASDKRVNGLYTTKDGRNSWMNIVGTGWVKLNTANDNTCQAMTILASLAKSKNFRIDYAVDAGVTTEVYIW